MTDTTQATTTVTELTMEQRIWRAADALYEFIDRHYRHPSENESMDGAVAFLVNAALAAAPPLAPSELEQAIAECEAKGFSWTIVRGAGRATAYATVVSRGVDTEVEVGADTPGIALRNALKQALAAERSAGEGTSDE